VTADGETYSLPAPFFVVATRNPTEQIGTFPLPESQLDRFLMQITLGYPLPAEERQLLANGDRRDLVDQLESTLSVDALLNLQNSVTNIHVSDALLDYVQAIVAHTRESGMFRAGLSPRGAIALVRASQSWAMMSGHSGVYPEDVQAVLHSVVGHRLEPAQDTEMQPAGIGE
jgi:MoxR-like ATPase